MALMLLLESKNEMPLPILDPSQVQPKSQAIHFVAPFGCFCSFFPLCTFLSPSTNSVQYQNDKKRISKPKGQEEISFLYEHVILNTYMRFNIRWLQGFKRTYGRIHPDAEKPA